MVRGAVVAWCLLLGTPVALAAVLAGPDGPGAEGGGGGAPSPAAVAEIPPALLATYRAAAATCPGLAWQVLAAVGFVESRHGGGRLDPATGDVRPPILGPPLDGRDGRALVRDPSSPDGYARALGPMQFLPATWARWGTLAPDRPPGAAPDPHNAYDAAFTAARYLCGGRPALGELRAALGTYNRSAAWADAVLAKAAAYGWGAPPEGAPVPPAADARAAELAVAAAVGQLGRPYVWGGASPETGFDCSGLVQWAYRQAGVALPRTTTGQVGAGIAVALGDLRLGDLVFSRSVRDGRVVELGHVALYAGAGLVVVAPRSGEVVSLLPLRPESVQAVRRVAW